MAIAELDKPHYHGHRDRVRDKFIHDDGTTMADYELLELILFAAIPRVDVKPLAKNLIAQFGSLADVLTADLDELEAVNGIKRNSAIHLKSFQAASKRLAKQRLDDRPVLGAWQDLIDYCYTAMAHEKKEQFRILFLNNRNVLIKDEVQQVGTINHTPVYPREVVKRALELGATALILLHNHPSGDPKPSKDDIKMTQVIIDAAKGVGITIHDHIIIGKAGPYSFRNAGLV